MKKSEMIALFYCCQTKFDEGQLSSYTDYINQFEEVESQISALLEARDARASAAASQQANHSPINKERF